MVELPEEALEMIFRHLSCRQLVQVRRTCHRWKSVVDGSTVLTRKFCLKFPPDTLMDRDYDPVCWLPAGAVKIQQTRIVTVDPWWSSFGSKLVEIILDNCTTSLPGLANMLRQTPNVKSIDFESLYCPEIYEVATLANFQLNQMVKLRLINCVPSICDLLGNVCARIIWFQSDAHPDDNGTLKYLEKWESALESVLVTPTEDMLSAISSLRNLRLTTLHLVCSFIRTDQVIPFLQRFERLKNLQLIDILLPDSILRDIGQILPDLSILVVDINRDTVWNMSFLNAMPNLEQFRVVWRPPAINNAESTIANFQGCRSRKLQQLKLYGLEPSDWNDFYEFLKEAPNLHSVTLKAFLIPTWCTIFETLPMTKLRSLSLSAIVLKTNVLSDSLVEYYENLRRLKLNNVNMPGITLQVLLRLCPNLEVVSICQLGSLDDFAVLVLCKKLKRLADLTIHDCPITDASVGHIIEHCAVLERLDIQNCRGITPAVLDRIVHSWLNNITGRVMSRIL